MRHATTLVLMAFFSLPVFGSDTKESVFWHWFQKNEERVFTFERDRDHVFDDLAAALQKVHSDLTFEFGPVGSAGRREFVISAAGIQSAFPAVETLCSSAPELKKWIIVKFRPRRSPINDLELAGKKIRASDVRCLLFRDEKPGKVGVMVFLNGYREGQRSAFAQYGYLFLDEALGEYDVETRLGAIVFQGSDSKYFADAHPLADLANNFDDYFAKQIK